MKLNAAFIGGGIASVIGLGGYAEVCEEIQFTSFSGASIGSLIASCLAAGKTPQEIRDFLVENVEDFCKPILGKWKIRRGVDEFLDDILFKDLPMDTLVSITPLKKNFPKLITQENSEELTVGRVVALSATLPGLFFPSFVEIEEEQAIVLDGGIILNPPLNVRARNAIFSYNNPGSLKNTSWNRKRWAQEANAEAVFHPHTSSGILGGKEEVKKAFEFGQKCMLEEKHSFLCQINHCRL